METECGKIEACSRLMIKCCNQVPCVSVLEMLGPPSCFYKDEC